MRKEKVKILSLIALAYFGMELLGVTCPIKFFTGISCAGCGMSRAWLAFLHGEIRLAFSYHPLFLLAAPLVALLLFRRRIPKGVFRVVLLAMVGLFFAVYVVRLINPEDTVVVFQPVEGLVPRIIRWIHQR